MFLEQRYFAGWIGHAVLTAASKVALCVLTLPGCSAEQSDTDTGLTGTAGSGAVTSGDATTGGSAPTAGVGASQGAGTTGAAATGTGGSVNSPAGMGGDSAAGSPAMGGSGGDARGSGVQAGPQLRAPA